MKDKHHSDEAMQTTGRVITQMAIKLFYENMNIQPHINMSRRNTAEAEKEIDVTSL